MMYGKLYSSILTKKLSVTSLRLYLVLSTFIFSRNNTDIEISLEILRKKLKLSGKDKVSLAVKELEKNNLIIVKRSKINDKLNNINVYNIKKLKNKFSLIPENLFFLSKNDLKCFALLSQKNRFLNYIDHDLISKKLLLSKRSIQNSINNLIKKQIITTYELNNKIYYVINKKYNSIVDHKELLLIDNI